MAAIMKLPPSLRACARRFVGDDGHAAAGSLEQGTHTLYGQRLSAHRYPQLALLRDGRPAENRRGDKVLLVLLVRFPQEPGEFDTDGGERHMDCVWLHCSQDARCVVCTEYDGFRRRIVAQHGEDDRDPGDCFGS
jgi:hypothetical protein